MHQIQVVREILGHEVSKWSCELCLVCGAAPWPRKCSHACQEAVVTQVLNPPTFILHRKGVCTDLRYSAEAEWHKWIHPRAPNARLVWRSLVSALVCKSLWYAWTRDDLACNIRSIV